MNKIIQEIINKKIGKTSVTYTVNPKYIKKIINATNYFECNKDLIKRMYNRAVLITNPPYYDMEVKSKRNISNKNKEMFIIINNIPTDIPEYYFTFYKTLAIDYLSKIKCKTIELISTEQYDPTEYPIDPYGVYGEENFFSYE